ncbi:MAG TPA: hypothetical protein VE093_20780 [Polyangiaceae bacterium]|jgi:hypothetical protein|nr:hypothetical protein [Polyangiaceae bacterium]
MGSAARSRRLRLAGITALLALASLGSCSDEEKLSPVPLPSIPCDSTAVSSALEPSAATAISVQIDPGNDANLAALRADIPSYLGALWQGASVTVSEQTSAPPAAPLTVWLSTGEAAKQASGAADLTDGYALRRLESEGGPVLLVYAPDTRNLAHGGYALLEELGARFFHPMQEFVPRLPGVFIPKALSSDRASPFKVRGLQLHLLHPIEYFATIHEASDEHLAEAKRLIDWLVKTGQNHIQWWLLKGVDWEANKPHVTAIIDYAHARGLTVWGVAQLWGGASLQGGISLVDEEEGWQAQLEGRIDHILSLPFDGIELGLGEFFATDPAKLIEWLNHGTAYVGQKGAELAVVNHVGNYPDLYVDYQGKTEFFYFLPRYADPNLINTVHTVFLYDLYREGGMYNHPNFHGHREFLFEELSKRKVQYLPESAYWVTADIDVPAFLPEYIRSRWIDVHNLDADIRQKGLPPLHGHIVFSSGHEWGYWLTDYLTAKMLWEPGKDLDSFIRAYTGAYGSCSSDIHKVFNGFLNLQTKYLFEQELIPYISGEDVYDDLGVAIKKDTHPPRVRFEEALAMAEEARAGFEASVLVKLGEMVDAIAPLEETAQAACRGSDEALAPFCDELADGIAIVRLRLLHSIRLYEAIFDHARGGGRAKALLDEAAAITDEAAKVIARREASYRFEKERLVGAYENPTIYKFGYLRQAHTQCLWRRQEEQAAFVIANGVGPSPFAVRPCTD